MEINCIKTELVVAKFQDLCRNYVLIYEIAHT